MSPRVRLGDLLLAEGLCDAERLREALERQGVLGGRLGTNLLELGVLDEAVLANALARIHGVKEAHGELPLAREVLKLLDPRLAAKHEVIPWRVHGRQLDLLCRDPGDLTALDEVAFATGLRVVPWVVPEARLWALLREAYRVERPERGLATPTPAPRAAPQPPSPADLMAERDFVVLYGDRGGVTPPAAVPVPPPELAPVAPPPPPAPATASVPATAVAPQRRRAPPGPLLTPECSEILTTDELMRELQADATAQQDRTEALVLGGDAPPLSFEGAMAAFEGLTDRAAMGRVILRHARTFFERAVLLAVHEGGADGWMGIGEGVTPQTVARVHLDFDEPGIVRTAVETRAHVLGPMLRTKPNLALLRALASGAPKNAFALPVLARGRVVHVLYGDAGRGRFVEPDGLGELLILAARFGRSYEALLDVGR